MRNTDAGNAPKRAIATSLAVGVVVLLLKSAAFLVTGSSALLTDALESTINVLASGFAMWSIHVAQTPPDKNHPYGHGRIEYFSVFFEGGLILAAAIGIIITAAPRMIDPLPLTHLDTGLGISVLASTANLALALHLLRVGRSTNTMTLIADGKHILTDVYTTAGVLAGLAAVRLTGWLWLDGAIACAVALHIVRTGYGLVRNAVKGLMNEADAVLLQRLNRSLRQAASEDCLSVHAVRAWMSGRDVYVDMHVVLPRGLSLAEAQQCTAKLEKMLRRDNPDVAGVHLKLEICNDATCRACRHASRCRHGHAESPSAATRQEDSRRA
uniref:Cation diffusion facilitator family transporter n=1 Tax=Nitratidesulfovibrio vulgaris (strain DSM 19637 / Miyazaki F) TaxID=883 RepID=B8DR42_NITV9